MIHALSGEYNFDVITALLGHAEPEIAIPAEDSISVVVPGLGASRPVVEVDLEALHVGDGTLPVDVAPRRIAVGGGGREVALVGLSMLGLATYRPPDGPVPFQR